MTSTHALVSYNKMLGMTILGFSFPVQKLLLVNLVSPSLKFCSRQSIICVGSHMTLSPWTRTGTSPAGFRCMNHGSLCSLRGRLTSYSSHCKPFSAIARRTWKNSCHSEQTFTGFPKMIKQSSKLSSVICSYVIEYGGLLI